MHVTKKFINRACMFINWFKKSKMEHNRYIFHAVEVYSLAEIEQKVFQV